MKKILILILCLCFGMGLLTGCDPKYPQGKLEIADISNLSEGESVEIEIIYPNRDSTAVIGWKNQSAEIISGEDVISISGLTITGLKTGTAIIKVKATTLMDAEAGLEDKEYSTEIKVTVK